MKVHAFLFLLAFCYAECRKVLSINKNANIDFINMEVGGMRPPPSNNRPTPAPTVTKPVVPTQLPQAVTQAPQKPAAPATPQKPAAPTTPQKPAAPAPVKPAPTQTPTLITPKPVNPTPAAKPISTPGPGSVQSLINFYDTQGKGSPIRPYSYSQAVKQG